MFDISSVRYITLVMDLNYDILILSAAAIASRDAKVAHSMCKGKDFSSERAAQFRNSTDN
jgi:hypothetical protein